MKHSYLSVSVLIIIVLALSSCAVPKVTPSSPEPKDTPGTPTEVPFAETITDFEIIFSGEDCSVTGPSEVQAGEKTFKFIDKSGKYAYMWMHYLDEDKTFQDNLDLQSEPGEWVPKPTWAHYADQLNSDSKTIDDYRVDIETWSLDKERLYVIICYQATPQRIWFQAPITVLESSTD